MDLWKAALLGLVQGFTEFFPVSSDGHLVALERWLGAQHAGSESPFVAFVAFLHAGTLFACLVAFRRELAPRIAALFTPRRWWRPAAGDEIGEDVRFVIVASLVTAAGALPLKDWFESLYPNTAVVVGSMVATGVLLLIARPALRVAPRPIDLWQPLLMGVAQVLAILPGLSRSCSTVVVGLLLGVPIARVAWLSFLMSMPAVAGAVALEWIGHPPHADLLPPIALGIVVAFVSGLFAVRAMIRLVPRGRMHWFAPYMFALAAAVALTSR